MNDQIVYNRIDEAEKDPATGRLNRPQLEVLVAALQENDITLAERMNLSTEAIICNQCQEVSYREFRRRNRRIRTLSFNERGVGRNRNNALMRADADYVLFADEDIVYDDDYEECILHAFGEHPEADILMFNVRAVDGRRTYENRRVKRVRWYNYGRYPTYAMAGRLVSLRKANVWFSLLFGGGAAYSNGEDSLFLHDCLQKGLKILAVPVEIGHEAAREDNASTWFCGYNEKFFYDRGVLYHYLYGPLERILALRFVLRHRKTMCREIPTGKAYRIMCRGMREA